ncbi:TrmB family transcriptional regulator [Priestia megaterium]|uniref:TrmB family transcriptional regulator n=1 Tax=Priestia megaterium TaxID=1404 RepID=UPI002E20E111|nr:helix-turn-helix domain-containing protein [Priestia megaterium]MED4268305.1 helix-turn-helix domain-containing protein [Priestia megaterium]MED4280228.1 helix-turn-helix domain-containing protein [Priestia megaterium]MED4319574.1 helix-turn-helix domain-containing protein [Priestia megaterium]
MEKLIDSLMEIGFSKNESKAYLSLLKQSPLTGYEISKQSGVPRSMIYQTINKLVAHGAINEVRSDPITYTPVPPNEFIGRLRQEKEETFDYLQENLKQIQHPPEVHVIRHIQERSTVIERMNDLISKANHEVWLSVWNSEVDDIAPYTKRAIDSNIQLYSLLFNCEPRNHFGRAFYHHPSTADIEEQRMNQRLTIVVSDNKEVLIAGFSRDTVPSALLTEDPMLVLLAKEYIRHDIMMKVMSEHSSEEKMNQIWKEDSDLFYIVTNELLNKKINKGEA